MCSLTKKLLLLLLAESVVCWDGKVLTQWHLSDLKGYRNISIEKMLALLETYIRDSMM